MVINGVNLPDIDVADALAMERYEHAHDNVAKAMDDLHPEGKRQSELIRAQCTAVFNFLMKFSVTAQLKRYLANQ